MAVTKGDFDGLVTRLNTATSAIAAKLQKARDDLARALADKGIPESEEADAFANLDTSIKALEQMGSDPATPIPDQV